MPRIVACVACLVALALAGCGAAATPRTHGPPRLQRGLAQRWENQAKAIAAAATAGNGCRAQQLAGSLRDDVIAATSRIPLKLRQPLLASVNALANRITCVPPTDTVTVATHPKPHPEQPKKKKEPHPKPPKKHGPTQQGGG